MGFRNRAEGSGFRGLGFRVWGGFGNARNENASLYHDVQATKLRKTTKTPRAVSMS